MNKKVISGLIIAIMVVIIGGVAYYFYNQASADAYSQSYCAGFTGGAWRQCNQNTITMRKFLAGHSLSQFQKMTKYANSLSK